VNTYETDEQAIKRWWQENGKMVVTGVVLVLAAVVGTRWWLDRAETQAQTASAEYQQLLTELAQDNREAVIKRGTYLIENYDGTPYGALAALVLAKVRTEAGELAAARSRLEWVRENAPLPELQDLARLRLARVHLAEGNPQLALNILATVTNEAFTVLTEEIRGDVHVAMGNEAAARTAYEKALAHREPGSDDRLLRMKLNELGGGDA